MSRTFFSYAVALLVELSISVCATAQNTPPYRSAEVSCSGTLPVLYIHTENNQPITSKTEYLNATYWLDAMGAEGMESVGSAAEPAEMQIRGRGNSSWLGDKKPYKIKLASKTSLLGMPKNKHWALLKPLEANAAGMELGALMGFAWTPRYRSVEVVLNDEYIGMYFLSETVRIDKNRVNIHEQPDGETDPELIKGGWLVEIDNYDDEYQIKIPETDDWDLRVTYHSPEELSAAQRDWLTDEITTINSAIYSDDLSSAEWEKYIDAESMARFFILQEVMDNPDGFNGSFYLHKDLKDDAKWVAGPIWDIASYDREKTDYTFRLKAEYYFIPHWITGLIRYESFCNAVRKVWGEVYDRLPQVDAMIEASLLPTREAWKNDDIRWTGNSRYDVDYRVNWIKRIIHRNIEWLNEHLPESQSGAAPVVSVDPAAVGPVKVYNLQGICVGEFADEQAAAALLPEGLYIARGRKFSVR